MDNEVLGLLFPLLLAADEIFLDTVHRASACMTLRGLACFLCAQGRPNHSYFSSCFFKIKTTTNSDK
uniref:Uncharacterized protein n=1 Tax=Anguilla anguilla TaxID=7936 RepID=A0A0E9SU01_ANGAN